MDAMLWYGSGMFAADLMSAKSVLGKFGTNRDHHSAHGTNSIGSSCACYDLSLAYLFTAPLYSRNILVWAFTRSFHTKD